MSTRIRLKCGKHQVEYLRNVPDSITHYQDGVVVIDLDSELALLELIHRSNLLLNGMKKANNPGVEPDGVLKVFYPSETFNGCEHRLSHTTREFSQQHNHLVYCVACSNCGFYVEAVTQEIGQKRFHKERMKP